MINIVEKSKCTGCTACANSCPQKCITMIQDEEGFYYPKINIERCIDCGLCDKICENTNEFDAANDVNFFVARDKRIDVLRNSTSGGVYTSMMEYVLTNGGVVYGVILDENKIVKFVRVDDINNANFKKIPGSKYVKSMIHDIFNKVKNDLNLGKKVLFSGTPCQVAGLISFLRKKYENLITVDLVCHGTPSPLLWEKYVNFMEYRYSSEIVDVKFRNKTYGYHHGTMMIKFKNGKIYYGSARTDLFLKCFFSDLCSRPSCYDCKYKRINRLSDITIFDSWHASEINNKIIDDDKGYTNVITQNYKGYLFLKELDDKLDLYESDLHKGVELDGIMINNSVKWTKDRQVFFNDINSVSLNKHCNKFFKITVFDKVIEKSKSFLLKKDK